MFSNVVIDCSGARDAALAGLQEHAALVAAARTIPPENLAQIREQRAKSLADRDVFVADMSRRGVAGLVPELMPGGPRVVELPPYADIPHVLLDELAAILAFMTARASALTGDHAIGITIRLAPNRHRADDGDTGFTAQVSYSEYPEI